MAPRGLAKARDYDYSNVGKMGRRTGITLKEGRRDEHGMEELDGMFSSPEKSPVRFNGVNTGNDTMIGSEGMSMDEGNGPGPTDFLSRSAARRSPFFPPPTRSPRKNGLSGSPRRTPGVRSSPMVQSDHVSSSPSSGRQRRTATDTTARQPLNDRRPNTAPIANGVRQKGRDFDSNTGEFTNENDENQPVHEDEDEDEEEVNDLSTFQADLAEEDLDVHEIGDDGFGDDSDSTTPDDNDNDNSENDDQSEEEASPVQAASLRNNKKGRKPAAPASGDVDMTTEDIPQSPPKRKRQGRPPKSQSSAKEDAESQRPTKKAKTTSRTERAQQPQQPPEPLDPELEKVVENHVKRSGPLKGRSLYILKREEPSNERTGHTRSGRVSVRPLAYWRNERCVYGDGEADLGQRYPLSTIKEIIRTEELQPETKGKKRKSSKKSKGKGKKDDESDDDDERDQWEMDDGVLHGFVKTWDSEKNAVTTEEEVSEIAYSKAGIQTRDVKDSTFKVAKLFSDSYIGSGIVELPPKGVKKPKNSKRMHMIFYVCAGRVQVDINGIQFTVGKGCIFQVPRGNYYSFANTYHKAARLFFSQAFIPTDENASSSKRSADEAEAENDIENENENEDLGATSDAPPPKPKGRGRGRAKASSKS